MDSLKQFGPQVGHAPAPRTAAPNPMLDIQKGVPGLLVGMLSPNPMVAINLAVKLESQVRDLTARQLTPLGAITLNQTLKPLFGEFLPGTRTPLPAYMISQSRDAIGQAAHTVTLNTMNLLRGQYDAKNPQAPQNKQVLGDMQRVMASALHTETQQQALQIFRETQQPLMPTDDVRLATKAHRTPPPPPIFPKPTGRAEMKPTSVGLQRRARVDKTMGSRAAGRLGIGVNTNAQDTQTQGLEVVVSDAKRTVPAHDYEPVRHHFGGHKFSRLAPHLGLGTLTPTMASGAWGKVRFMLTDKNEELAVKESRLAPKPGLSKFNKPKTRQSDLRQIQKETHLTIAARKPIDEKLNLPEFSKLNVTRSSVTPFVVHRMITDLVRNKVYVLMNREAGTVAELEKAVSADLKPTLAMSIAAQGFVELGLLHKEAQIAHMDLKADNLLFSKSGQIKIMDYGLATPTRMNATNASGLCGSIVSPEMVFARQPGEPLRKLTTANDVWAMGVIIASTAAPTGVSNPFIPSRDELKRAARAGQTSYPAFMGSRMLAFQAWGNAIRGPNGQIDVRRIQFDRQGGFNDFFARLAAQEPQLCDLLLNHVLVADPNRRMTATRLGRRVLELLPSSDTAEFAALRSTAEEVDRNSDVVKMMGNAVKFRQWENNYWSTKSPAVPWPKGQARALP